MRARYRTTETDPRVIYRALRQPFWSETPNLWDTGPRRLIPGLRAQDAWKGAKWTAEGNRLRAELESNGWRFEWVGDDDYDWQGSVPDMDSSKAETEQRCPYCLSLPSRFEPGIHQRHPEYSCDHYAEGCYVVSPDGEKRYDIALWGIVDADGEYRAEVEREHAYELTRWLAEQDREQETRVFTLGG